jgi:CHAD domain-containing protein
MAYELGLHRVPDSIRTTAREQLVGAAERLERPEDPVEAVHDARKRIKKTRALLRLARPGLKPKAYRRRNRALRDTGRGLSGARDADVLAETVDALAKRFVGRLPERFFAAARAPLAARAEAEREATDPREHAAALHSLAQAEWPLRELSGDALAESLKRTYARGRDAFALADRKPTATNLHEWRKRVKDLWYQERLLQDSWPSVMKAQAEEAKKLSKLLGEDHDLAVLAEHVKDPELLELIEQRRAELLDRSRALGRRIYAERPKAFARRARRYVDLAAA